MYQVDPLSDPRWTEFVNRHPRSSAFHTTGWLKSLNATYGFKPLAVTPSRPKTELANALLLCSIESWVTGRRLVSLPYSDYCEPLCDSSELADILDWLKLQCTKDRYKYAELRPLTVSPDTLHPGRRFAFHLLDISLPEDKLFATFDRKCIQNRIRHASQQNLSYEHGRDESLLRKWYKLVLLTRQRHQLPPQPLSWFRNLLASAGSAATIHILSKDNQPIAGILTLTHKQSVMCKYAASDQAFNNIGAMPLLFWNVIKQSKAEGCRELDFGRSDLDNDGLLKFKQRWGAKRSDLVYWRYPNSPGLTDDRWYVRAAKSVFSVAPEPLLQASGRLLYKHFD